MIDQEIIKEFVEEVEEHIRAFEEAGLALEKKPEESALVNDLFRAAHSIKGAAGYMGFTRITDLSHKMENVIDLVRDKSLIPDKKLMDILFQCIDRIRKITAEIESDGTEKSEISDLIKLIDGFIEKDSTLATNSGKTEPENESPQDNPPSTDADKEVREIFIQQSTEYLTQLLQLFGDLLANVDPKGTIGQMVSVVVDFIQLVSYIEEKKVERLLRELAEKLQEMHESDTVNLEHWLSTVSGSLSAILEELSDELKIDEKLAETLHEQTHAPNISEKREAKSIPEKDEGLFAFPLDEEDKSLLDELDHTETSSGTIPEEGEKSDRIDERVLEKALESQNIEDEIFGRATDTQVKDPDSKTNQETKEESEKKDDSAFNQPIIIDEEAVVHSIEEKFKEEHLVSEDEADKTDRQIISEEYDEELFNIFLDSFQDNLSQLSKIEADLKSGKTSTPLIEKAIKYVDRMISSANYMDYDVVIHCLEKWRRELSELLTDTEQHHEKYSELLSLYTQKLCTIIPALKVRLESGSLEEISEDVDISEVSSASAELEVKIDTMFDLIESEQKDVRLEESGETAFAEPTDEAKDEETSDAGASSVKIAQASVELTHPEDSETSGKSEPSLTELVSKQTLRVDAQKVDNLLNQVGELVVTRAGFAQTTELFREMIRQFTEENKLGKQDLKLLRNISFRLSESSVSLGRVANELQEAVMKIRMLPVHHLFQRFPRLVRNQSEALNKKVNLEIQGSDTELDKRVLEQMADPFVHLLRNAIAHGIESSDIRQKLGKPEEGTITISAYHEGNHVILEVSDDGQGIDIPRLKKVLVEKGIITNRDLERLSNKEIINSIFLPGVSTSDTVTETSGRGVGMDIVKENVEHLNGSIEVRSEPGKGTKFIIKIPLTVAIIQALLVKVSDQIFTIPLTSVLEITRVFREEIETIEGFEVIHLRDTTIPLLRLQEIFNLPKTSTAQSRTFVVIVSVGNMEIGLIVDSLLGEQEVVIKPLTESLKENKGFSGATILGDGSISLIIDVAELADLVRARNLTSNSQLSTVA